MKNLKKKVMILNNFTSPYISEAIIILKDYDPQFDTKAILEAEKIVNNYLHKNDGQPHRTVRLRTKVIKFCSILLLMGICFSAGLFLNR